MGHFVLYRGGKAFLATPMFDYMISGSNTHKYQAITNIKNCDGTSNSYDGWAATNRYAYCLAQTDGGTSYDRIVATSDTYASATENDYSANEVSGIVISIQNVTIARDENNKIYQTALLRATSSNSSSTTINGIKKIGKNPYGNDVLLWGYFFNSPLTIPANGYVDFAYSWGLNMAIPDVS